MKFRVVAITSLLCALATAAACESDDETTGSGGNTPGPVCGDGITAATEACDPAAAPSTWTCPTRTCSAECACEVGAPGGTGGTGGTGGSGAGGTGAGGGVGAGLPIGGIGAVSCEAASGSPGALQLTEIATGFEQPVLGVAPPNEGGRLYVVEQAGRVLLYEDGSAHVFLDVVDKVSCCGERGLLGLAFHPDYAQNGRFFIHYSDAATGGDSVVEEYARDPDNPDYALAEPVGAALLTEEQPAGNHNGGAIDISPVDGHLYVALGDGGGSNDTYGNGQNLATRLGGILRLDISQTPAVAAGMYPGGDAYLWDVGLRNPWRASFDRCTGDLYIGDVGQGAIEEIDVEPAGSGHRNYGWNTMEGSACFSPPSGCDTTGLTLPVAEYPQSSLECSVTGGFVYRGSAIPWLRGTYFYGDYCSGRTWSFSYNGATADNLVDRSDDLGSLGMRLSSFGQDASGEIYLFDYATGTLYRLDAE